MIVPFGATVGGLQPGQQPQEGDWRCPTCNDIQFARNPTCRKCGTQRPHYLAVAKGATAEESQLALMPSIPELAGLAMGGEWQCPICKEITFAGRNTCRRCNCPRPEGPKIENTVQHQLAGGGYIGYLPDVSKVEATSSWAKQWDAPAAPAMMPFAALCDDSVGPRCASSDSSSDSSSDLSSDSEPKKKRRKTESKNQDAKSSSESSSASSDSEQKKKKLEAKKAKKKQKDKKSKKAKEKGKGKVKEKSAKAKAKAKEMEKANVKKAAKAEKKRKKAMDVEQELEKRRLQRERRKARAIALDD
mmetsp:Transcript_2013/g.4011  ORF Transcript_2013/g.4011 Transcript_2013/m.4011 type:complete len:303 (+) Transcript_2013:149-1057(+)